MRPGGARCDDGAARCPKCLRTQLVAAGDAPAPRRMPASVVAIFAIAIPTATFAVWNSVLARLAALDGGAPAGAEDPARRAPSSRSPSRGCAVWVTPWVARAAVEAVTQRRRASLAGEDDAVPPPRSPDLVWRVLLVARAG
ncbi:MAG: hypothetical protein U0325_35610 [Polyangiales bacterium]